MVFNSLVFLIFITAFFPLYFLLKGRNRMWLCLLASYLFYGWWDWRFLFLVAFTTTLDYSLGIIIDKTEDPKKRKQLLILSVISNLGFLGFFKYFNFFIDSTASLIRSMGMVPSFHTLHIILPIGISFYTFQSMSYTIDVYRKEFKPEKDFFKFATFVSLFPQLVAGPIVRARKFLPQFNDDKPFEWNRIIEGLGWVLWGFFKKVAIADSLAPFVDQCFAAPDNYGSLHLLVGVILYSFQIYCDFSGYSNIAIGIAHAMGYEFPINFRTPYFSKNFSEFWTRWHISLSSWLRDYLYISLGGNRGGKLMTYRNNMITMVLGGLWHGANFTFIVWGFLHGAYLIIQRILGPILGKIENAIRMPKMMQTGIDIAMVYFFTCLAWIFFRAANVNTAFTMIKKIASFEQFNWTSVQNKFNVMQAIVMIGILIVAELVNLRKDLMTLALKNPWFRVAAYSFLILLVAFFGTFSANSFIYFQF
jgi:alginate O-acetyltransferase complex protein AlgI